VKIFDFKRRKIVSNPFPEAEKKIVRASCQKHKNHKLNFSIFLSLSVNKTPWKENSAIPHSRPLSLVIQFRLESEEESFGMKATRWISCWERCN
jgi:hypothetical protein